MWELSTLKNKKAPGMIPGAENVSICQIPTEDYINIEVSQMHGSKSETNSYHHQAPKK